MSGWGSGMSFVITTMGRWQSGLRRRDWAPASIMAADMMCRERRQCTDRRSQYADLEKHHEGAGNVLYVELEMGFVIQAELGLCQGVWCLAIGILWLFGLWVLIWKVSA